MTNIFQITILYNYFTNVGNSLASSIQSENDPLAYLQTYIKSIYIHKL